MSVVLGRYDSTNSSSDILKIDAALEPSGTTRHYLSLFDNWDGSFTMFSLARGRVPNIAVHSWTDTPRHRILWRDVTAGKYDDDILGHAMAYKAIPGRTVPAYLVFHHEPENEEDGKVSGDLPAGETCGTKQEFKDAFEHFRALVRTVLDGTDALIGCTLMAGSFRSGRWRDWVPQKYQFLGVDGYSHGSAKETFSYCTWAAHDAAVEANKKLFIEEIGCEEVPTEPSFKADFFADIRSMTKSWTELLGIQYSNTVAKGDYRIMTSDASTGAWKALAQDPYFVGNWT